MALYFQRLKKLGSKLQNNVTAIRGPSSWGGEQKIMLFVQCQVA